MDTVSPKVAASAAASGVTAPVATVIMWLIGMTGAVIPPEVATAMGILLSTLAGAAAGYLVRHDPPPTPAPAPVAQPAIIIPPAA